MPNSTDKNSIPTYPLIHANREAKVTNWRTTPGMPLNPLPRREDYSDLLNSSDSREITIVNGRVRGVDTIEVSPLAL